MGFLRKLFQVEKPWNPMNTAPRDGTEIEIKCTYGCEPSVSRAQWQLHPSAGAIWRSPGMDDSCFTFFQDVDWAPRSDGANNSQLQWRLP